MVQIDPDGAFLDPDSAFFAPRWCILSTRMVHSCGSEYQVNNSPTEYAGCSVFFFFGAFLVQKKIAKEMKTIIYNIQSTRCDVVLLQNATYGTELLYERNRTMERITQEIVSVNQMQCRKSNKAQGGGRK
jgi:hypothetical protein